MTQARLSSAAALRRQQPAKALMFEWHNDVCSGAASSSPAGSGPEMGCSCPRRLSRPAARACCLPGRSCRALHSSCTSAESRKQLIGTHTQGVSSCAQSYIIALSSGRALRIQLPLHLQVLHECSMRALQTRPQAWQCAERGHSSADGCRAGQQLLCVWSASRLLLRDAGSIGLHLRLDLQAQRLSVQGDDTRQPTKPAALHGSTVTDRAVQPFSCSARCSRGSTCLAVAACTRAWCSGEAGHSVASSCACRG